MFWMDMLEFCHGYLFFCIMLLDFPFYSLYLFPYNFVSVFFNQPSFSCSCLFWVGSLISCFYFVLAVFGLWVIVGRGIESLTVNFRRTLHYFLFFFCHIASVFPPKSKEAPMLYFCVGQRIFLEGAGETTLLVPTCSFFKVEWPH